MADALTIAELRARIRTIEGGSRIEHPREPSGCAAVDALIGGLPRPGLIELHGAEGSGVDRLALTLAAAETGTRRRVAWIDRPRTLYPPAALALGVDLDRLLVIQPADAAAGAWAIEQVLRCGCFRLVVAVAERGVAEPRFAGTRWRQAAEKGACTALFVTRESATRALQPDVRLVVAHGRISVDRDRQRHAGAVGWLPQAGQAVDPWAVDPVVPQTVPRNA